MTFLALVTRGDPAPRGHQAVSGDICGGPNWGAPGASRGRALRLSPHSATPENDRAPMSECRGRTLDQTMWRPRACARCCLSRVFKPGCLPFAGPGLQSPGHAAPVWTLVEQAVRATGPQGGSPPRCPPSLSSQMAIIEPQAAPRLASRGRGL